MTLAGVCVDKMLAAPCLCPVTDVFLVKKYISLKYSRVLCVFVFVCVCVCVFVCVCVCLCVCVCVCNIMQLLSVAFCLVRAVRKFDFRLVTTYKMATR